jgi:hypothetical protein
MRRVFGKLMFEVKLLVYDAGTNFSMYGLLDQATAGGAGLDSFTPANGGRWFSVNGDGWPGGSGVFPAALSGSFSLTSGDVIGIPMNIGTGDFWIYKNGVSLAGDAVAGTGAPGTDFLGLTVCPSVSLNVLNDKVQLITSGTFSFPLTGYSGWN